nr:MAG TPA: hypothetical protein [Caudoviricetes sp.]
MIASSRWQEPSLTSMPARPSRRSISQKQYSCAAMSD